jgi:hypothetical protein
MAHIRKKHGERKDKKNARMREAEEYKAGSAGPDQPTTDQWEVQTYKPGGPTDKTVAERRAPSKRKP